MTVIGSCPRCWRRLSPLGLCDCRPATADDYAEPLAGMIRRGEIDPPDELVIDDRAAPPRKDAG